MKISRFHFLAVLFAAVCSVASAQTRTPTRILSGFPPGGNVDLLARLFAERLSEATGRAVVVENRPGAVGQIAGEVLKSAAPDGNTLMVAPDATVVIRPLTMKKPPSTRSTSRRSRTRAASTTRSGSARTFPPGT